MSGKRARALRRLAKQLEAGNNNGTITLRGRRCFGRDAIYKALKRNWRKA